MEIQTQNLIPANDPADVTRPPVAPAPAPSHTQAHPTLPPHTKTESTISAPDEFTRIFLLALAVRYIPRGLFAEVFEKNAFSFVKKPVDGFINSAVLNRMETKMGKILSENKDLVAQIKKNPHLLESGEGRTLFDKLKSSIFNWRGDQEKEVAHIVSNAVAEKDGYKLAQDSHSHLQDMVRGKLKDIGYSLSLFAGSSLLSLRYSRLVRSDIKNLFRESVAYEKGIPQEQVTFNDIANSDNRIVRSTVENYHSRLWGRLSSDSLFLLTAPLKSTNVTDLLLGVKGVQIFRDTWKRKPTVFEDLITFVNNKLNPINGLGQPISVGEVFDLYQHYAKAFTPESAFTGVIEHAQGESARWAGNQIIFQRITELMNKTYAYKHDSILDPGTGHTVLQGDFALPKFIYLMGHDLIDVNQPKKTLVAIELANNYGIPGVKDMNALLKEGKSLDDIIVHYNLTLPTPRTAQLPATTPNAVIAKSATKQLDAKEGTPVSQVAADSVVRAAEPLAQASAHATLV